MQMSVKDIKSLYLNRKLSMGYPEIETKGIHYYYNHQSNQPYTLAAMKCIEKLIDVAKGPRTVMVVGCGPNPHSIRELLSIGYDAVGLDAVPEYVTSARDFLGDPRRVELGNAEEMPFPNGFNRIILMENVLEHVDSPTKSLAEACRILLPGGVLYISTTNRWKLSLRGENFEFRVRFYNWFSDLVKESYVFQHLHYDPSLANYTPRPAVHWFSYSDLCNLGRQAGFAQFYSWIDLVDEDSPFVSKSWLRRFLLDRVRFSPWLRALALTQAGGSIFMFKRP